MGTLHDVPYFPANFYLTAAALLPILPFVELRFGTYRPSADALRGLAWGGVFGVAIQCVLLPFAEFAALRSLELGHSTFAAPVLVWVAIAVTGIQLVVSMLLAALSVAISSRSLDTPSPGDESTPKA